jgi:hypothetical protein
VENYQPGIMSNLFTRRSAATLFSFFNFLLEDEGRESLELQPQLWVENIDPTNGPIGTCCKIQHHGGMTT